LLKLGGGKMANNYKLKFTIFIISSCLIMIVFFILNYFIQLDWKTKHLINAIIIIILAINNIYIFFSNITLRKDKYLLIYIIVVVSLPCILVGIVFLFPTYIIKLNVALFSIVIISLIFLIIFFIKNVKRVNNFKK